MSKWEENEEIQIFREYLRIPSVHPNIDYEPCLKFLRAQAKSLDLPMSIYYPVNKQNPVVVMTWLGSEPNLPSIMLNSHMDVVPAYEEYWTHPPFAAQIDEDGKIFARGTQDMKNIGAQYLASIRALKRDGIQQFKRTIHVIYVPDEELGYLGMKEFVKMEEFKALNVGFALDEGDASPDETFTVYYGERTIWQIEFQCNGQSGHGSLFYENTPGEKVHYLINKFMEFRKSELEKLKNNKNLSTGDVTTINLTMMHGGVQGNVVPPALNFTLDIRLANDVDLDQFEQEINQWCLEAGGDVNLKYTDKEPKAPITPIDGTNPYWIAFKSATDELNLKIKTSVMPGGTDSRYLRIEKIPALCFSPINNTPVLAHHHDEYIHADMYLSGINIYKKLISKLANV